MKRLISIILMIMLITVSGTCEASVGGRLARSVIRTTVRVGGKGTKAFVRKVMQGVKASPIKVSPVVAEETAVAKTASKYITIAIKQPSTVTILVGITVISGYVAWRIVRTMHGYEHQISQLTKEIKDGQKVNVSVIRNSVQKVFPDSQVSITESKPSEKSSWEKELGAMYGR